VIISRRPGAIVSHPPPVLPGPPQQVIDTRTNEVVEVLRHGITIFLSLSLLVEVERVAGGQCPVSVLDEWTATLLLMPFYAAKHDTQV